MLGQTRQEIIVEIVRSFIAASSESSFCPKLSVVLTPSDVNNHNIDLLKISDFLIHECEFSQAMTPATTVSAIGEGIG
jgi:hypothetical protein